MVLRILRELNITLMPFVFTPLHAAFLLLCKLAAVDILKI